MRTWLGSWPGWQIWCVAATGLAAREFSLIAFATEMFDLQRRHGIHAAPELIFPLLSLLMKGRFGSR
ncbi:hypothetical protein F4560_003659 [Saccharothrix ecbatanensis]|uniref:Uncharacterized protein n=1 Tax=Saccharothrix ecbatanensis TaxID=1105145 RepID=A0A7W9M1F3_9PSEU|nr:hypothetical protein [Saccharothrix ecbatanensis]MBB5803891.1 hypothetical protein [Saccharothrix ecbatanensis]